MEEKAVLDIIGILTQEGMTYRQARKVFEKVQLILMESSKNFLDSSNAKEVLGTPNRYSEKKALSYENGRPVFKDEREDNRNGGE